MNMHPFKADADGTSCPIRLLTSFWVAALLLGLPFGVLAEDVDNGSGVGRAGNTGGDRGLSHMSDVRPDASTPVLPSFGGDPFAADPFDAAPDAMPETEHPLAENKSGQGEIGESPETAEAPDVPNFGALPDIAKADQAREERERADKNRSRNNQSRDMDVQGKDSQDKDAQKRDAQGREHASRGDGKGDADKADERPGIGDRLAIPEGAAQSRDTSFLAGCWRSESTLRRTGTDIPLQIEYCFDENGNGRRIHTETNNRCEGPITAAFKQRTLVIEGGEIPCTDGTNYRPTTVECSEADGNTICSGKESKPDGGHNLWDARFRKSS